jgi:hypothetical protein
MNNLTKPITYAFVFFTFALTGCASDQRIAELEEKITAKQRATALIREQISSAETELTSIADGISKLEKVQTSLAKEYSAIKAESPTLSSCIAGNLTTRGTLHMLFGESELERNVGAAAAFVCGAAQFHDEYKKVDFLINNVVSRFNESAALSKQMVRSYTETEGNLKQLKANLGSSGHESQIQILQNTIACEKDMLCRARRIASAN